MVKVFWGRLLEEYYSRQISIEWTPSVKRIYTNSKTRGLILVYSQHLSEYGKCCIGYKMIRVELKWSVEIWAWNRLRWRSNAAFGWRWEWSSYYHLQWWEYWKYIIIIESRFMTKYTCQGNSYFFHRKNSTLSRRPSICYRNPHIELLYWGRFEFPLPGSIYVKSPPVLSSDGGGKYISANSYVFCASVDRI